MDREYCTDPDGKPCFPQYGLAPPTASFVVECDITAQADLISVIRSAGGKVVK